MQALQKKGFGLGLLGFGLLGLRLQVLQQGSLALLALKHMAEIVNVPRNATKGRGLSWDPRFAQDTDPVVFKHETQLPTHQGEALRSLVIAQEIS